jgi:hypothetical protein
MDLWQGTAAKEMTTFLTNILDAEKIECAGSLLDTSSLDLYSDVDMDITLQKEAAFCMKELTDKLSKQYNIFGYETYSHNDKDVLRVCFENGWRFDLSFYYTKTKEAPPKHDAFEDSSRITVNQFWFMAVMVLVKLGRKDFLVASHLALELCQLTIVFQMLVRDDRKKTNIHRFGDSEDVPILHSLFDSKNPAEWKNGDMASKIQYVLFQAAEQMDVLSEEQNLEYTRRSGILKALQQKFRLS